MKKIVWILIGLTALMTACEEHTEVTPSSDASVTTFALKNDSFPNLNKTSFVVEALSDTGRIYPIDSLSYGIRLDSLVPSISFGHTPSAAYLVMPDTIVTLTGSDTLDFSVSPIYLRVVAADEKTVQVYRVEVYVHNVDPDLYVWECMTDGICMPEAAEQKAINLRGEWLFYMNNGSCIRGYHSADTRTWSEQPVSGLPWNVAISNMVNTNDTLCCAQGTTLYTSSDGFSWHSTDLSGQGYTILSTVASLNDMTWVLVEEDGTETYNLMAVVHGQIISPDGVEWSNVSTDFPVSQSAVVSYQTQTGQEHVLVAGGYSQTGVMVDGWWNIECQQVYTGNKQTCHYRLTNYTREYASMPASANMAIVWYNEQLIRCGGMNSNLETDDNMRSSVDQGISWQDMDSTHCQRPASYEPRFSQSMLTDGEYIYLIGGKNTKKAYTDVYRARLNSILW